MYARTHACVVLVQGQIECFNECGPGAFTLGLRDGPNRLGDCCNSIGGGAFIDLENEGAGCQTCEDIGSESDFDSIVTCSAYSYI